MAGSVQGARRELAEVLSRDGGNLLRSRVDWLRLMAAASLVAAAALLAFATVRLTGGSPNPLNHLGYLPILIAAYTYGWVAQCRSHWPSPSSSDR